MTRISVRGVAVASATAVTAVGAVVGVASGSEGATPQSVDVAGATLLADVPSSAQAQVISDNFAVQSTAQQQSADLAAQKAAQEAARLKAAADAQAKADADKAAADAAAKAAADAQAKAAADAQAKAAAQQAAQQAAARAAAKSQLAVTNDTATAPVSGGSAQSIAASMMDASSFQCFSNIVSRESGWDYTATNAGSGAYGLVQALPGSKMASAGSDWRTNPATQIKWGLGYMNDRYGSPCGAWSFWQAHSWY
ncbi:lytic transglycosylase domain-containing protein [Kitasatospora sp. NBC_01250]|uniref:aggregation-promoting factor C-terminal-like domain-containing protein n=1 Tax=unclassified Kitasatospora TaxID=2633591 RepID=UPI002E15DDDE|nr:MULTISPECIES: lytic transglycosylase domain-containing protein [unclassified Kitasatospora]WSJ68988.1 lytic transglycosylase domain-containing protein [Kitasatospora sp. NBC_01302]